MMQLKPISAFYMYLQATGEP